MTPETLAQLHAAAFTLERPWSASEFAALLDSPHVRLFTRPHGFALTRSVAGESELLTLAVDPDRQRRGIGRDLVRSWLAATADAGAEVAFLEVAADNLPALALYYALGFRESGLRKGYYTRTGAPAADAIVMQYRLTLGQTGESTVQTPESG